MVLLIAVIVVVAFVLVMLYYSTKAEKKDKRILELEQRVQRHNEWLSKLVGKEPLEITREVKTVVQRGGIPLA